MYASENIRVKLHTNLMIYIYITFPYDKLTKGSLNCIAGISPSASLVTDLKAIAGNDSRYMQYSSPSDMATQFNTIFQKIAICPTIVLEPMTFGKSLNP